MTRTVRNQYHGCQVVSDYSAAGPAHEVFRDGKTIGTFRSLAAAIRAAKLPQTATVPKKGK